MTARPADLVIVNAAVRTMDPAAPRAVAVAVRHNRIAAVGTTDDIRERCGRRTQVIDAKGRAVLPGFQDSHAHPALAGVEMVRCDLTGAATREECLHLISSYAAGNREVPWIRGGGWAMALFSRGGPTVEELDAVVGKRPAYLPNDGHHSAWVSSEALERAGITAETPDPADGRIERDASGKPTGLLHDGATDLVERLLPPLQRVDYETGILAAQTRLHSLGVTGWQDAMVSIDHGRDNIYEAYLALASSGRLTARVVGAMWWDRHHGVEQVEDLVARRDRARKEVDASRFRASSVKIMQDGVCGTFTAAMLTPYLDDSGAPTHNCGLSFVEPEELKSHVTALDAEGFQVHFHAIGDRAVRESLDAVEAARTANGSGGRHHLAHLQVVHPDDYARFVQLGVAANFQPLWACEDKHMVELTIPFLGPERAACQYPIGSLARLGVPIAFGSDWPVSSPNPFEEAHVAVTRTPVRSACEHDAETTAFLPDERVTVGSALAAFTRGSAFVNGVEDSAGSIGIGKLADLVLLDRNPWELDAISGGLAETRVLLTVVDGRTVHAAADL